MKIFTHLQRHVRNAIANHLFLIARFFINSSSFDLSETFVWELNSWPIFSFGLRLIGLYPTFANCFDIVSRSLSRVPVFFLLIFFKSFLLILKCLPQKVYPPETTINPNKLGKSHSTSLSAINPLGITTAPDNIFEVWFKRFSVSSNNS